MISWIFFVFLPPSPQSPYIAISSWPYYINDSSPQIIFFYLFNGGEILRLLFLWSFFSVCFSITVSFRPSSHIPRETLISLSLNSPPEFLPLADPALNSWRSQCVFWPYSRVPSVLNFSCGACFYDRFDFFSLSFPTMIHGSPSCPLPCNMWERQCHDFRLFFFSITFFSPSFLEVSP